MEVQSNCAKPAALISAQQPLSMKHRASIAAYSKEAHVSLHRLKAISESQYFINPGEEIVDVPSALTFLAEEVYTQCMPSVRRSHNGLKYSKQK